MERIAEKPAGKQALCANWREYFKPWVAKMVEVVHAHNLPVIYHGCGNVKTIFQDYIDIGIDGYHPLEAKAGMAMRGLPSGKMASVSV